MKKKNLVYVALAADILHEGHINILKIANKYFQSRLINKMIISKTPLRMSFVGGGSDLPAFYRDHGGAVISSSINKYVYIILKKKF